MPYLFWFILGGAAGDLTKKQKIDGGHKEMYMKTIPGETGTRAG